MVSDKLQILDFLLRSQKTVSHEAIPDLDSWKIRFDAVVERWDDTADRAAAGGFFSDRLAYAFAAGYQCAIKRLAPSIPDGVFASFCITEEGGGHPAAITTSLEEQNGVYAVNGAKQFITMADVAKIFLVAANDGPGDGVRKNLRIVRIEKNNPGIVIVPMPELKFVPEVGHCRITMTDARIKESDILPGDGFTEYIRPFRTVEDLHVFTAVTGYLFRCSCLYGWNRSLRELMLGLITTIRSLSHEDPSGPHLHITMGGLQRQFDNLLDVLEPLWDSVDDESRKRWIRDRALLKVAGNLRAKRLEKAWEKYG